MELSKKLLLALAALALVSVGFMGCTTEDDDDEYGMISGRNNNYSIDYTNPDNVKHRGYQTTTAAHQGGIIQISFTNVSKNAGNGVMGFIWDLKKSSDENVAKNEEARDLFIIGFNYGYPTANKMNYYVSKFTNVTDLQADNFGTELTTNKAIEDTIIHSSGSAIFDTLDIDVVDDTATVYVDVAPTEDENNKETGGYTITLYSDLNVSRLTGNVKEGTPIGSPIVIDVDKTGYNAETDTSEGSTKGVPQQTLGVYANVYETTETKTSTLTGTWKYLYDYKDAEVIEDAE